MRDFFYGLIVVIFLLLAWDMKDLPQQYELNDFNNSVIIDKKDDFFYGRQFYVKYPNDSIVKIRCYDIIWEKYNVGDTIQ